MRISDWSSDVCSSDLTIVPGAAGQDVLPAVASDGIRAVPALHILYPRHLFFECEDLRHPRRAADEIYLQGMRRSRVVDGVDSLAAVEVVATATADQRVVARIADEYVGLRAASECVVACPSSYPVRSEEHTSELQSLMRLSYAVFCLKK